MKRFHRTYREQDFHRSLVERDTDGAEEGIGTTLQDAYHGPKSDSQRREPGSHCRRRRARGIELTAASEIQPPTFRTDETDPRGAGDVARRHLDMRVAATRSIQAS